MVRWSKIGSAVDFTENHFCISLFDFPVMQEMEEALWNELKVEENFSKPICERCVWGTEAEGRLIEFLD